MTESYSFFLYPADKCHEESALTLPRHVYDEIVRRWKRVVVPQVYGVAIKFDVTDSDAAEILQFLRAHSREPWLRAYPEHPTDDPRLYTITGVREFSKEDLERADYLKPFATKDIGQVDRHNGTNYLELVASDIKKQLIGNSLESLTTICTNEIKLDMENQGFIGLAFRPVYVRSRKKHPPKYWQWWSTLTMPPLINRLVQDDGTPVNPNNPRGSCYVDDLFCPYLPRFSEQRVRKMEPFDLALTLERIGPGFHEKIDLDPFALRDPWLIVSQRFRKWAISRKLKIQWTPAALE